MTAQQRNAFAEACGLSGPLGLLVKGPGEAAARRYRLEQPFALLGRDPRADMCLDGEEVSQRHVYIQVVAGHVYCMDLNSRTGTYWDDVPQAAGWLLPGQVIRIGPHEVWLEAVGAGNAEVAATPVPEWSPIETRQPEAALGLSAGVEFVGQGNDRPRCRLTRLLTLVGRAPACRLRLRSQEVSRHHCALLRTPMGVWVIDLLGRGSIRVNGARVVCCPLAAGDQLRVGDFEMRLRLPISASSPAASAEKGRLARPRCPRCDLPFPWPPSGRWACCPRSRRSTPAAWALVVRELRLMQQDMFDHFHQALMAMMQMFGSVHQDQMGLIREELERIRASGQELQELRGERARQAPASPAPQSSVAPAASRPPRPAAPPPPAAPRAEPVNGAAAATSPTDGGIHVWLSARIERWSRSDRAGGKRS